MIFGKTKMELKVGIFVFTGLAILVLFVLYIGGVQTWGAGYSVILEYNFVNGVKQGAPVRYAGVDVGEVKNLEFYIPPGELQTKVHITISIREEVKIPADSTIWVNTLGLLGEKYIEIIPGEDFTRFIMPGQKMIGKDPVPMHEITDLAKSVVEHVDQTVQDIDESIVMIKNQEGSLGKLIYGENLYNEIEALIVDLKKNPWKLFWKQTEK